MLFKQSNKLGNLFCVWRRNHLFKIPALGTIIKTMGHLAVPFKPSAENPNSMEIDRELMAERSMVCSACQLFDVRPFDRPIVRPSDRPTVRPSDRPSVRPCDLPTVRPVDRPTGRPSVRPAVHPSERASE